MRLSNTPQGVVVARGRVLIVASSDSSGGTGVQAGIKTVTALGGYAASAVTLLTARDTEDVYSIFDIPTDFIRKQMEVLVADIGADVVLAGTLQRKELVQQFASFLETHLPKVPLVLDPKLALKSTALIVEKGVDEAIKLFLLPKVKLITPSIGEAELLTGIPVTNLDSMKKAAEVIHALGAENVLMKGGGLKGELIHDVLFDGKSHITFENRRIDSTNLYGAGFTLASAIATCLAKGYGLVDSIAIARKFVFESIRTAPGFGRGKGPLNHSHTVCLIE